MKFSIIVPTISDDKVLINLLGWFRGLNYSECELVIVDQNAKTRAILIDPELDNVVYSHQTQRGLSRNRNIGIDLCSGEWIIFLDDNCSFDRKYFDIFDNLFRINEELGIVHSTICNQIGELTTRVNNSRIRLNLRMIDYGAAAGMIVRRTVFDKIKFDENMGVGAYYGSCEEYDFVARAIENNFKVVIEPTLQIFHPEPETCDLREYNYGKGHGYLVKKRLQAKTRGINNLVFISRRIFAATVKFIFGHFLRAIGKKSGTKKIRWSEGFFHGLFMLPLGRV